MGDELVLTRNRFILRLLRQNFAHVEGPRFEDENHITYDVWNRRREPDDEDCVRIAFGRRFLGDHAAVRPAGRLRGFKALLTKMVLGIGLYQGLEYLMHRGVLSALALTPTFLRRLAFAVKLCLRTKLGFVELGGDVERNVKTIEAFLEAEFGGHE